MRTRRPTSTSWEERPLRWGSGSSRSTWTTLASRLPENIIEMTENAFENAEEFEFVDLKLLRSRTYRLPRSRSRRRMLANGPAFHLTLSALTSVQFSVWQFLYFRSVFCYFIRINLFVNRIRYRFGSCRTESRQNSDLEGYFDFRSGMLF